MNEPAWPPERCPACDGSLRAAEPWAESSLLRCLSCGHSVAALARSPVPSWLDGDLSDDATPSFSWADFDEAVEHANFLRRIGRDSGALLDLCPGRSAFVALAAATPWKPHVATLQRARLDGFVFPTVTLWHGLSLSPTPVTVLDQIRPLIAPSGTLVLSVPVAPAPGLQVFSRISAALVLERAGFQVESLHPEALPPRAGSNFAAVAGAARAAMGRVPVDRLRDLAWRDAAFVRVVAVRG